MSEPRWRQPLLRRWLRLSEPCIAPEPEGLGKPQGCGFLNRQCVCTHVHKCMCVWYVWSTPAASAASTPFQVLSSQSPGPQGISLAWQEGAHLRRSGTEERLETEALPLLPANIALRKLQTCEDPGCCYCPLADKMTSSPVLMARPEIAPAGAHPAPGLLGLLETQLLCSYFLFIPCPRSNVSTGLFHFHCARASHFPDTPTKLWITTPHEEAPPRDGSAPA